MHLVVDIFSTFLKSLVNGPTQEQFNVFVQKQFETYKKELLDPKSLSKELRSGVVQLYHHPVWEKYKRLRSISFTDFQQFCCSFCMQVKIEAMVQGNIDKNHSIDIMQNLLKNLQCERIHNVSRFNLLYPMEKSVQYFFYSRFFSYLPDHYTNRN